MNRQLYLHDLERGEATPIDGTENSQTPFLSPDGEWLGFWNYPEGKLMKIALSGGAPIPLCETPPFHGASWGADGVIVLGMSEKGIWRVSADGGTPEVLVTVDAQKGELAQSPQILPGGNAVLFTLSTARNWDAALVVAQSLESGERRVVLEGGTDARYVPTGPGGPTGHLVYALRSSLFAVSFDPRELRSGDRPIPILEHVARPIGSTSSGVSHFAFSDSGTLAYIPEGTETPPRLVVVDREGQATPLTEERRMYQQIDLSPDGERLAVAIEERGKSDIWIYDIGLDRFGRLTSDGGRGGLWSPDGEWVAFTSDRDGDIAPYRKRVDADDPAEKLLDRELVQGPTAWSPDGKTIIYQEHHPDTRRDLWALPLDGNGEPRPWLRSPFEELRPDFSPDGQWLTYMSYLTGQFEIYVQPFPGPGKRWQISTDGGLCPLWSPDGREIFFEYEKKWMAVTVATEPEFTALAPRVLFGLPDVSGVRRAAVMPDGERFVMIWPGDEAGELQGRELKVVLNWHQELKRLVPVD